MKYLNDYVSEAQEQAFKDSGAFFAFNSDQLSEGLSKLPNNVKLVPIGGGLYCPSAKADWLINEINRIHDEGISQDINDNGLFNIAKREINNYECKYSGYLTDDCLRTLSMYGINEKQANLAFRGINFEKTI